MSTLAIYQRYFSKHANKKIICMGRNYTAQVSEYNTPADSQMWFDKHFSSVVANGGEIPLNPNGIVNHEVELGLLWGKTARNIQGDDWREMIRGVFVGIDFTDHVYQQRSAKNGTPWSLAKG